jgi:hypothetical protein
MSKCSEALETNHNVYGLVFLVVGKGHQNGTSYLVLMLDRLEHSISVVVVVVCSLLLCTCREAVRLKLWQMTSNRQRRRQWSRADQLPHQTFPSLASPHK